jgi:tetratricopeptide (TPR) repeat protein
LLSVLGAPGRGGLVPTLYAQTPPGPAAAAPAAAPAPAKPAEGHEPTQEEVDAAKQHFDSGVEFFQRGNYFAARAEFEAAYALSRYPQLLYNLGKTAEKLNQTGDAIRYLEQYLAAMPTAPDAAEVRTKLAELRKRPDAAQTAPPLIGAPPAQPSSRPPIPALALLGAGAGLLIIGIGCGAGALADQSAIQSVVNGKTADPSFNSTYNQGKALNGAAIAFDVLGGLSLAAGGAWTGYWLYQKKKAAKQPAPAVSLIPVGLGAGVAGRF